MIFDKILFKNITKIVQRDFLTIIIALLTSIILTRNLGIKIYGEYLLVILIPTTAEIFLRLKFDYSSVYLISKKIILASEMIFFQLVYSFFITFLFFVILTVIRNVNPNQIFNILLFDEIFFLIILLFLMRILFINFTYLYIQQLNYKIYNFIIVFNSLFNVILLSILFYIDVSIISALLASSISLFVVNTFCLINLYLKIKIKIFFNFNKFKEILIFSIKHYFIGLIEFLFSNSHQYIISLNFSTNLLANFNLAKMIADMSCKPLNAGFSNVYYSELSKKSSPKDSRVFLTSLKLLLLIFIIIYFFLIFFVDDIVSLLYGSEFIKVSSYFIYIMPSSIFLSLSTIFYSYFSSRALQNTFLKGISISLITYVVSYIILKNYLYEKAIFLSLFLSSLILIIILISNFLKINNMNKISLLISNHEIKLIKFIFKKYVSKN